MNDLAEIFLGLFVPWETVPDLFRRHAGRPNIYSHIWALTKLTLAPHNQEFTANIELLRKSKEDCQVDAMLRQSEYRYAEVFDRYINHLHQTDLGSDSEQNGDCIIAPEDERFIAETLIAAYYTVTKIWSRDYFVAAKRTPILTDFHRPPDPPHINLVPKDTQSFCSGQASDLTFFPPTILRD